MSMFDSLAPVLIVGITVGGFFTMIILISYFKTRKSERISLWASGRDLKDQIVPKSKGTDNGVIKYGLLLVGLGAGLVVGDVLYRMGLITNPETAYFSMLMVLGGIGLLISHLVIEKKEKDQL